MGWKAWFTNWINGGFGLVGIPIGIAISKIPGLNKLHADPESIQKRFGILANQWWWELLSEAIGALGGYDVGGILKMGINMGAVMFLMPRIVKILMEGLIPISESVRDFYKNVMAVKEKFI